MERIPGNDTADDDVEERRINDLMNKRGISYYMAREILGVPSEVIPTQRGIEETSQSDYNPARDKNGRELPHYYKASEPLGEAEVRAQEMINQAGSARVRAVLAALKEAKQDHQENNTSK